MAAFADTASLMPVADALLDQFRPDNNTGGNTTMSAGKLAPQGGTAVHRAVLQFDLSSLPAGAQINSATLRVTVVKVPPSPANSSFGVRRLLESWDEGAVTWNSRLSGVPWNAPGAEGAGDSVPNDSSSVFVTSYGSYTFPSTPTLLADMQAWANNPGTNFGWLLVSENEVTFSTARVFGTHEDPFNTPVLTVNYSLPPTILTQPDDQSVIEGSTATFSVVASGSPPLTYQWQIDGGDVPGATNTTFEVADVQTNAAGFYSVAVVVSSPAGSTTSRTARLTVLSADALFVAITSPAPHANFAEGADVVVNATATESNATVTQVEFFLGTSSATNSAGVATNSPFSVVLTNLAAGAYTVFAVATDSNGGTNTSAAVAFRVLAPPVVTLTLTPSRPSVPVGTPITNTAAVAEPTVVANVQFFTEASLLGTVSNAPFVLVWTPAEPRSYSVTAVATDVTGQSTTSAPVVIRAFTSDSVPPEIALTRTPPNFARQTVAAVSLAGTATDNIGLDRVEYQVNGGPSQAASGTSAWSAQVALAPGPNTVKVRAVDLAGNVSRDITRFFTYVLDAPLAVLVAPPGGGTVTPNLDGHVREVGKFLNLTARPATGQLFAGWTAAAGTNSVPLAGTNNTRLHFQMLSNLTLTANFATNPFPPLAGTYAGLFLNPAYVTAETSAMFTLRLTKQGSFSGKLTMNGAHYGFHGRFSPDGEATVPVLRHGLAPVVLGLQLSLTNVPGQISGFATNAPPVGVVPVRAEQTVPGSQTHLAGKNSFVLHLSAGETAGSGLANIIASGRVRVQGTVGGERFELATALTGSSEAPMYVSFGEGRKVLIGRLHFPDSPAGSIDGTLFWTQSGADGFSVQLSSAER